MNDDDDERKEEEEKWELIAPLPFAPQIYIIVPHTRLR